MTTKSPKTDRTVTFDCRAFSDKPEAGSFIVSPSGRRFSRVIIATTVKQLGQGSRKATAYRLTLEPIVKRALPPDAKVLAIKRNWRPTIHHETVAPIQPDQAKARAAHAKRDKANGIALEAMRVSELLRDDRDKHRQVHSIRTKTIIGSDGAIIRNATAETATWRDPDDNSPTRRTAKQVHGYRAADVLNSMAVRSGRITRKHRSAANRLRTDNELAAGARPGYQRPEISDRSFGSGSGPQERQLAALRSFENAKAAVGRKLFDILDHVVLQNRYVSEYTKRHGLKNEQFVMGILVSALDRLSEHYEPPKQRHTIRTDT